MSVQFSKMPTALVLDSSLTANAIRVWHVVYTETLGRPDWDLSHSQIAEKIGSTRRTVIDAIAALLERGWLTRRLSNRGSGQTYVYEALEQPASHEKSPSQGYAETCSGGWEETCSGTWEETCAHQKSHSGESQTGENQNQRAGARRGRNDDMKSYGREPDDPQDMPEEGRAEKPKKKEKKFESVPPEDTHARVMYEYSTGLAHLRVRAPRTVMLRAVKNLHDEGYSYAEIAMLVRTFLSRHEADIRAKSGEIDPAVLFQQVRYQLINQTSNQIADKRAGRETSKERSERQGAELLARFRGEA